MRVTANSGARWWQWAMVVAALLAGSVAYAQPDNVFVACLGGTNCPVGAGASPYTDLQDAIDDAVVEARTSGEQSIVLVVGGPYTGNFTIPADANVHMIGLTFNAEQIVTVINNTAPPQPTSGDFTLTFTNPLTDVESTTGPIAWDATAADVQTELEGLASIGVGNVTVTGPDGGPWTVQFQGALANVVLPLLVADDTNLLPAEAFVLVQSTDGPQDILVEAPGMGAALRIEGITAADRDEGVGRDRLIVEGISFRNGDQGILISGGDFPATLIQPTLNRVYVIDNDEGIRIEGSSRPLIVNSSISDNNGDGVHIAGAPGQGTFADILHCSILDNEGSGVRAETGNNARVRNTLIFRNGSGIGEGGLVWEDNLFIDPDEGPLDGGIDVEITGTNLVYPAGSTEVFFGPPAAGNTEATGYGAQTATTLDDVVVPPAYNGLPGPVDVYIVRGDGFQIRVPRGFTYVADVTGADPVPVVYRVEPGFGPIDEVSTTTVDESAIDVLVYGANFDPDCSVFFSEDSVPLPAEQSPEVHWFSPGLLLARVATSAVAQKVDVLVRNNPTGQVSAEGPLEEYEYRAGITGARPRIEGIVPNSVDSPAGLPASASSDLLPDIFGDNFAQDCVVKIGGVVCSYASVSAGGTLILDVVVPPSPTGGAGLFDVEVINPNGLADIAPQSFTYFAASAPGLAAFPWRTGNFVQRTVGGDRSIIGHGFDDTVDLIADPAGVNSTYAPNTPVIEQREIPFTYPPDTDGLGLAAGQRLVPIRVSNAGTTVDTELVYAEVFTNLAPGAGGAVYFEIESVTTAAVGNPDTIEMSILNYRGQSPPLFLPQFEIFVGDVQVNPANITLTLAPNPPGNYNGIIQFPAPAQPEGVWGPVDIRVQNPDGNTENQTGITLYTIAEDAYSYRRAGEDPQADVVVPGTVPDDGSGGDVRILGKNFTGMTDVTTGQLNPAGVYTRAWLDNTANPGLEIDLSTQSTSYRVDSFSQITFDINLDGVDPGAALIPRNTPIDIVLEQFDGVNNVVIGNQTRLPGAVVFIDPAGITITAVTPNTGPVAGIDDGVDPEDAITITGTGFGAATEPIVLFGTSQAVVTAFTDTSIDVNLPAAPNYAPGVYDVTVINTTNLNFAVLEDGFTYTVDGAPVITSVSPNHVEFDPANPPANPDPLFVTITGYNFDDDVRVTFTEVTDSDIFERDSINNPTLVRVLSPTEITVTLSTTEWQGILDAMDYAGGLAAMQVTVQNEAQIPSTDPQAASLTSNPLDFFAFNDGRGNMSVLMPELLFNDVYRNNQDDYVNVSPGAGSISIDPGLLNNPWLGKLVPDIVAAPLLTTAGPFTELPYTSFDFELEARPQGDGAEIGADEIAEFGLDTCSWFYCSVSPSPVGITSPRQLIVRVQYNGNCGGAPFIVPQGGDPSDTGDRIALELYQTLGNGTYLYTNTAAIKTVINDPDGNGRPSAGDLIADGHAAVYMERGARIFGYDESVGPVFSASHLTDDIDVLRSDSQAYSGRHFLIDTVPPRLYLESGTYGMDDFQNFATANELVIAGNDALTADTPSLDAPTHPHGGPPSPPALLLDGALYSPSDPTLPWPVDYQGGIYFLPSPYTPPFRVAEGTQIFFNTGSESNFDTPTVSGGASLDFSVRVEFIDPPVTDPEDPAQTPLPGLDIFTDETIRQVAGFEIMGSQQTANETVGGQPADNLLRQNVVRWFPDATLNLTDGFAKNARYGPTDGGGANVGVFDPARAGTDRTVPSPGAAIAYDNYLISAEWDLIDLLPQAGQTWRVRAQFVGEDLAGNATTNASSTTTPNYYQTLFDPLQVWWMYDVASTLSGPTDCQVTNIPFFTVGLVGQRPSPTGGPYPAYTYNLWTSPTCNGVYTAPLGWRQWRSYNNIDLLTELTAAELAALQNQYVLIVSMGADEAGNVEAWPLAQFPDPNNIDLTDPNIQLPRNFKRFFFSNQPLPDTNVALELWYDFNGNDAIDAGEPSFGDSPIVAFNPALKARFAVSTTYDSPTGGTVHVDWNIQEDGILNTITPGTDLGPFASNADVIPIVAPNPPNDIVLEQTQPAGTLGAPDRAITYLFSAYAYDTGNTALQDPTPAIAYFVVVPEGVSDFVLSPEDQDKQPFKETGVE